MSNKKSWSNMTYEERMLHMTQCIESGYAIDGQCDWLENLQTGYEQDPDWFHFEIADEDWDSVFSCYATALASKIDFDLPDFEHYVGMSEIDCAKAYMLKWHEEGIKFDEDDLHEVMEDLYWKATNEK